MKSLEFIGTVICNVVNGIKIKLPDGWSDTALFKTTIPYERIVYLDKNGNDITYFNFYPDNAINGSSHTGNLLTRIDNDGYILLPTEARNNELLGDSVYLIGKGDHIEMRLKAPEVFHDSFYENVSHFLELFK